MGKLKDSITKKPAGDTYTLTVFEFSYLKDLNEALRSSVYHKRLMSGLLTYIAKTRLGFSDPQEGYNLQFEVDLAGDTRELTVRVMKTTEE